MPSTPWSHLSLVTSHSEGLSRKCASLCVGDNRACVEKHLSNAECETNVSVITLLTVSSEPASQEAVCNSAKKKIVDKHTRSRRISHKPRTHSNTPFRYLLCSKLSHLVKDRSLSRKCLNKAVWHNGFTVVCVAGGRDPNFSFCPKSSDMLFVRLSNTFHTLVFLFQGGTLGVKSSVFKARCDTGYMTSEMCFLSFWWPVIKRYTPPAAVSKSDIVKSTYFYLWIYDKVLCLCALSRIASTRFAVQILVDVFVPFVFSITTFLPPLSMFD